VSHEPISRQEFAAQIRDYQADAFRLEWQQHPVPDEQDAYQRFLAGSPLLPAQWPDWQGWLERVREWTRRGKVISRVILLDDQPCPYQQWRIWGATWHVTAGEGILFLPCSKAGELGIPVGNWWLFDDKRVVTMKVAAAGEVSGYTLTTEVSDYCAWRDLAVRHAAETVAT
jgi:hypothetical protein